MIRKRFLVILMMLTMAVTVVPSLVSASEAATSNNAPVLLRAKTVGKNKIKLTWNKVDGATRYAIYGNACKKHARQVKVIKKNSFVVKSIRGKKLKPNKSYFFAVYPCVGTKSIAKSNVVHFITGNKIGKYSNVKSIKAKKKQIYLYLDESKKVSAKYKMYYGKKHLPSTHGAKLKYISSNPKVATVDKKGNVKGLSKGEATIYIQDIGGKYCKTKVLVSGGKKPEPEEDPTPGPTPGPGPGPTPGPVIPTVTVTYNVNGGQSLAQTTKTVQVGKQYGDLPYPNRPGYTFIGWHTSQTGGQEITPTTIVTNQNNHTLYAHWAANTNTVYKVKHYLMNLDGETYSLAEDGIETKTGASDVQVTVPQKTFDGFEYDSTKSTNTGTIKPDGSLELKLYYTRLKYKLTLTAGQHGSVDLSPGVSYDDPANEKFFFGQTLSFDANSDEGYAFEVWKVNGTEDQSEDKNEESRTIVMPAEDTTYTASFVPGQHTRYRVRHLMQELDGTYKLYDTVNYTSEYEGVTGSTVHVTSADTNKVYPGFTINLSHPDTIDSGEVVATGALELKLYHDRNTYNLNLESDTNKGTIHLKTSSDAGGKFYYDKLVNFEAVPKEGYSFDKWQINGADDTSDAKNNPNRNIKVGSSDATYKALWKGNTYTVTFDTNGGSTPTIASADVTYGSPYGNFPDNPTRANHTFLGWYTSLDDNMPVSADSIVDKASNHTIYARWRPYTFKAVYDENDGANVLTFYYDSLDHSGSGKTVYEGNELIKSEGYDDIFRWGYSSHKYEIKSVVIDSSVADYTGLTNTSYMFFELYYADSITGVEYLDVSNVTDMHDMFDFFGYSSTTLATVPDISNWDTSKVEDVTYMFWGYGYNSSVLDFNLDLTNWDVSNISEYSGMFDITAQNANHWEVAIPKNTGSRANTPHRWFIGDGTDEEKYIEPTYSKMFALEYNLAFDVNGGDALSASDSARVVRTGLPYGELPTPTYSAHPNWTFMGWYTAPTGGAEISSGAIVDIAEDQTLYARWGAPYSVEYYLQNMDGTYPTVASSSDALVDVVETTADAEIKTFTGFTYDSTNVNNVTSGIISADGSLALKLYYTRNLHEIIVNGFHGLGNIVTTPNINEELPDGYEYVEYIETNGTQYINTGVTPNRQTEVELDFQLTSVQSGVSHILFSAAKSWHQKAFEAIILGDDDYNNILWVIDGYDGDSDSHRVSFASITKSTITERNKLEIKNNQAIFNGASKYIPGNNFTAPRTMTLFCYNRDNGHGEFAKMRCYAFKVWSDGTLIRDYVPALDTNTGEDGLYDRVNDQFYDNDGSGSFKGGSICRKGIYYYDRQIQISASADAGYTFEKWSDGNTDNPRNITVGDSDKTYTAVYKANKYTVTFDVNGGNPLASSSKQVTFDSKYGELPMPTRPDTDNMVFDGWYTESSGGIEVSSNSTVSIAGNHTLHAHWKEIHHITFHSNNGEGEMQPQGIASGESASIDENTFVCPDEGMTLENKSLGGRIFYINEDANNDGTYTFYDASGNTLNTHTVSGLSDAATYSVTGAHLVFKNWNTKADGTGISYEDLSDITLTESIDLYAQWEQSQDDKFYVLATNSSDGHAILKREVQWGAYGTSVGITTDGIGKGKPNTAAALANSECFSDNNSGTNTIWTWLKGKNDSNLNGYNDWFIPSTAELLVLYNSGIDKEDITNKIKGAYTYAELWSSVEDRSDRACAVDWSSGDSDDYRKNVGRSSFGVWGCVAARAF